LRPVAYLQLSRSMVFLQQNAKVQELAYFESGAQLRVKLSNEKLVTLMLANYTHVNSL